MMTEAEWLEWRRQGIGGSDVAAIMGISPFRSAIDVWEEKLGLRPPFEGTHLMRMGQLMEPIIAQLYVERTGKRLQKIGPRVMKGYDVVRGSLDRRIVGQLAGVELKLVAFKARDWGEDGSSDIPDYYYPQVQQYLAVTGWAYMDVPVLLGLAKPVSVFRVERDQAYIDDLVTFELEWWETHIEKGEQPPISGLTSDDNWVKRRHPVDDGTERVATPEELPLLDRLREAREAFGAAEKTKNQIEAEVKLRMGDTARLLGPGARINWGTVRPKPATEWDAVAVEMKQYALDLGVDPELVDGRFEAAVEAHQKAKAPYRRFEPVFTEDTE